jgi:hypothetical protein
MPEEKTVTVNVPIEATCPKCGHKFWHKVGDVLKSVVEGAGNAIAKNSNLGGDS